MLLYGCQGLSEALLPHMQECHSHQNTEDLQRSLSHFDILACLPGSQFQLHAEGDYGQERV